MKAFVTRFAAVVLAGSIAFGGRGKVSEGRPPTPPHPATPAATGGKPVPFPVGIPRPFPVGVGIPRPFPTPFPVGVGVPRPFPVGVPFPAGGMAGAPRMQPPAFVRSPGYVNPYSLMMNGMTVGQFAHNTAVLGRAFAPFNPALPALGLGFSGLAGLGGFGPYASLAASGLGGYGALGGFGPYASLAAGGLGGFGYLGGYGIDGYGMMGMFMNPAFANPFYGYLKGVADVTTANAQYWKTIEEARLLREQSYRSQLETRRKIIEEATWEREDWLRRIDPETNRQREQEVALDRARHDPPLTEVLSARALNDLFRHLSAQQGKGERGPNVPLDPELLEAINVTGQASRANVGLLKNKGELQWPLPLTGLEFKDNREHLERLLKDAVNQVQFGNRIEPGMLKDIKIALGRLNQTLSGEITEMPTSDYIEARRYLNLLGDAVQALEDPKAENYFNGNWIANGKGKNIGHVANVAELIDYMSKKGLRFAPAVPGEADAYRALYHALQAFDAGMTTVASSGKEGER
jgi:hypothetical protein